LRSFIFKAEFLAIDYAFEQSEGFVVRSNFIGKCLGHYPVRRVDRISLKCVSTFFKISAAVASIFSFPELKNAGRNFAQGSL